MARFIRKRKKSEFITYDLQPYTYKYELAPHLPEPWRHRADASELYLVPLKSLIPFMNPQELRDARKKDHLRTSLIGESILAEGLHEPCELTLDPSSKLRFNDGYHRAVVFLDHPELFEYIPVKLTLVHSHTKGFGRRIYDEPDAFFSLISKMAGRLNSHGISL